MRLNKRQERLAEGGHWPDVHKVCTGSTPTYPARPVYGTRVRCECGWKFKTNESPTKGGRGICLFHWERHAEPIVELNLDGTMTERRDLDGRW